MNQQLCIDIGNTLIKTALFDPNNQMQEKHTFGNEMELLKYMNNNSFKRIIISSVKGGENSLIACLQPELEVFIFGKNLTLPILNAYKTPETLGKDRLASAIGAFALFPNQNSLVIDAGTCVTYDFVSADGTYHGGAISPGMQMRFRALHDFTAKLPLLAPQGNADLIGKDTASCIRSGVVNGMKFEIEKTIEEYAANYPDLQVIVCGGDAHFFESIIKGVIFAFPDLVLFGLNHTLHHNAIS